jgi:hypothetical protein
MSGLSPQGDDDGYGIAPHSSLWRAGLGRPGARPEDPQVWKYE